MSLDGEQHQMANNPPGSDEPTASDPIVRSVTTKAGWAQQVAQRWLGASSGSSEPEPTLPARKYSQTGLTTPNTTSLLNRLQRTADKSAIWQPDVGSLNPIQVDRFTSAIVSRFPAPENKYQPQPLESSSSEATKLTLAGMSEEAAPESEPEAPSPTQLPFSVDQVRQALEGGGTPISTSSPPPPTSQPTPTPVQRTAAEPQQQNKALPFTLAEVRAALEQPHFTRTPATPPQSPANIQRTTTEQPSDPGQPPRSLPPRVRRFSRIEEFPPPKSGPSSAPSLTNETPDQADSLMDGAGDLDLPSRSSSPAIPPPIQRQIKAETFPASPSGRPRTPMSQRSIEPELTLPEPPVPSTPAEPVSQSSESAPPTSPSAKAAGDAPAASASEPARPVQASIQRQSAPELTLRQPASPTTSTETPASEAAQPVEPASQLSEPALSAPEPARPVQTSIQRQPAPSTPSINTPASEAAQPVQPASQLSEPAASAPEPARSVSPTIQRQPSPELTLREPALPTPSTETPASETAQPAELASQLSEPATPASEPARPVQTSIQRQPAPELTLRQPTSPTASTETSASETAQPAEPASRVSEPAAPASEPARPVQPTIQRQPDPELTLRQPTSPTPSTDTATSEAAQPAEPATQFSEPAAPTSEPARPVQPTIQRQPEPELTLRQPTPPTASTETSASKAAQSTEPASRLSEPAAPASEPARPVQPSIQRQAASDLDMPLRSPALQRSQAEPQSRETSDMTMGLEGDILAKAATGSRLPLTEPFTTHSGDLAKSRPPVQMAVLPQARLQTSSVAEPAVTPAEQPLPVPFSPASSAPSNEQPALPVAGPVRIQTSKAEPETSRPASPRPSISSSIPTIQRQPTSSTVSQSVESAAAEVASGLIQREETESTTSSITSSSPSQSATDLDKLARQIYPLLKRMLAVERERRPRY